MFFATAVLTALVLTIGQADRAAVQGGAPRLRVFLDCGDDGCHDQYLREEINLVEYVRDRSDADVHVLVTDAEIGGDGREYTFAFIGLRGTAATQRTLTVTTDASDSEDQVRRVLATTLTVGLLSYLAPGSIPAGLAVSAELADTGPALGSAASDPWRRWIFNINGNAQLEAEESTSEQNWGLGFGADRVTPAWKLSTGVWFDQSREEFDLDEDDRSLTVERRDRGVRWLAVRALGDHWSAGATGEAMSSTFDNTRLDVRAAPAIEWNFFPYSMYTRRQFRVLYAAGASRARYYEETLFGKIQETRARQEISATYEQREPWGTLEGRVEGSNYFPGLSTHRVSVDTEVDIRIARGLSLSLEASASRIQDQLSLPRRDASPAEVLLRLRQLSSGFETRVEFGLTYRFGSAFASIVNPRFGQ